MPTTTPTVAHCRWLIQADMPEVLAIERASFPTPWIWNDFMVRLHSTNTIGLVAEHSGRVVGYMIYELFRKRLHLLNFAVSPDMRRQGVGRQMLVKLTDKLSATRRTRIVTEVRESNLAAQLLFANNGFRATTILRGFYEETDEDAYVMEYRLAE